MMDQQTLSSSTHFQNALIKGVLEEPTPNANFFLAFKSLSLKHFSLTPSKAIVKTVGWKATAVAHSYYRSRKNLD